MANLLSGPFFGLIFDYTRHTKLIILFGNLFEIGGQYIFQLLMFTRFQQFIYLGNFMYFAAQSKYMVLASRFIVGEFNILESSAWNDHSYIKYSFIK